LLGSDINGHALHPSLPGGESDCHLKLRGQTLVAEMPSGEVLQLDLRRAELRRSGQGKQELVCAGTSPEAATFITRDPTLQAAVMHAWPAPTAANAKHARRRLTRFQIVVAAFASMVVLSVLGAVLLTGPCARMVLRLVPRSVDQTIGREALPHILARLGGGKRSPTTDADIQGPVEAVLDRLVAAEPTSPFQFHVTVCESPFFNAFALPGGEIVVTSGLLTSLGSSEELAAVLAHEMNHVLARHTMEMTIRASGARFLVHALSGGHLAIGIASSVWSAIGVMAYSRDKEGEADRLAVPLLVRADIDPHAMLRLFEKMAADEASSGLSVPDTATGQLLDKMRSHPQTAERIAQVSAMLASAPTVVPQPLPIDYPALAEAVRNRTARPTLPSP
jgi:beta-barrel assembly-enhancing protease